MGTFLCYARAVDLTMFPSLGFISTQKANPTKRTLVRIKNSLTIPPTILTPSPPLVPDVPQYSNPHLPMLDAVEIPIPDVEVESSYSEEAYEEDPSLTETQTQPKRINNVHPDQ